MWRRVIIPVQATLTDKVKTPSYLWQEHFPSSKEISHDLHAGHQGALDDVKGSSVAVNLSPTLLHILHHILLYSLTAPTEDGALQEKRQEMKTGNRQQVNH